MRFYLETKNGVKAGAYGSQTFMFCGPLQRLSTLVTAKFEYCSKRQMQTEKNHYFETVLISSF